MDDDTHKPVKVPRRIKRPGGRHLQILADPRRHPDIDGSGMLRGPVSGAVISDAGDVFVMRLHASRLGDYKATK